MRIGAFITQPKVIDRILEHPSASWTAPNPGYILGRGESKCLYCTIQPAQCIRCHNHGFVTAAQDDVALPSIREGNQIAFARGLEAFADERGLLLCRIHESDVCLHCCDCMVALRPISVSHGFVAVPTHFYKVVLAETAASPAPPEITQIISVTSYSVCSGSNGERTGSLSWRNGLRLTSAT